MQPLGISAILAMAAAQLFPIDPEAVLRTIRNCAKHWQGESMAEHLAGARSLAIDLLGGWEAERSVDEAI